MRTLANGGVLEKTLLLLVYAGIMEKSLAFTSTYGRGLCGVVRSRGAGRDILAPALLLAPIHRSA